MDEHSSLLQSYINGQNLTEFLIFNIESLLNYHRNGIDLKLLWTILCFHQETFLLIFLFLFLMQIIFQQLKLISKKLYRNSNKKIEIYSDKNSFSKSELFSLSQHSSIDDQTLSDNAKSLSLQLNLKNNYQQLLTNNETSTTIYYCLKKVFHQVLKKNNFNLTENSLE